MGEFTSAFSEVSPSKTTFFYFGGNIPKMSIIIELHFFLMGVVYLLRMADILKKINGINECYTHIIFI